MSLAQALTTFRAAIASALPTVATKVLDAQQVKADGPRPALPYVLLGVTADVGEGVTNPYQKNVAKAAPSVLSTQTAYERRQATVRLTWYGSGGADQLNTLRLAKLRPAVYAILRNGATGGIPISVYQLSDVLDTTALRSTNWEPAAAQDWAVRYLNTDAVDLDTIDSITVPVNEPEGD